MKILKQMVFLKQLLLTIITFYFESINGLHESNETQKSFIRQQQQTFPSGIIDILDILCNEKYLMIWKSMNELKMKRSNDERERRKTRRKNLLNGCYDE